MGITGLIPFLEKASRKANISEFSGCSVAIDSYCWLHKGAFACADKLVRGEETDIHIKYCMKYVNMLLSKNIKPILVFDGRHLPAKALTEAKRRESRNISKKRAAELLALGKTDEARTYMRRSVDITHTMALALMKECRQRNVDCIVAPYEADAQLAYLNIKNIAHVVITEDSDLLLFGCSKVFFKMDLDGAGILVEAAKLPLVMRSPIERYSFDKFRQMCIMSGCDYLPSLPGIGLAKARQFIIATHDPDIANALKKLPSFFNKSQLIVTDEYRENFLKAEATFKHQYVYDPITREMVRLNDTDDEETEIGFCCNAGELLEPHIAFQLALGNLDPFSLKKVDDWSPDDPLPLNNNIKTDNWKQTAISTHSSMWRKDFVKYLENPCPWRKKTVQKQLEPIITRPTIRSKKKVVNLISKYVPETEDMGLTIENLSNMYCVEPEKKRQKLEEFDSQLDENEHNIALSEDAINANLTETQVKSPILKTSIKTKLGLKKLSNFPRTVLGDNVVESKFFNSTEDVIEDLKKSPILTPDNKRNPFKKAISDRVVVEEVTLSQKENISEQTPNRGTVRNLFGIENSNDQCSEDIIENTYPLEELVTPVDSQESFGKSPPKVLNEWRSKHDNQSPVSPVSVVKTTLLVKKSNCKVPGLRKPSKTLPSNQPTLLSKFGFQKRPALKK